MTIQNLFVAELADILQVQLRCNCGAELSYNPDKSIQLPHECQQCHEAWRDEIVDSMDQRVVESFMRTIKETRKQQEGTKRLKIRLVFAGGTL